MSTELFRNLLASFKRSNKERKLKLAEKAGYKTVEEYKDYLEAQINSKDVKPAKTTKKVVEEQVTDMVIAFDTTGSMGSYIGAVKKHVKELIPTLFAQNSGLKISIVAFGDYCDMVNAVTFGNAYQVISLTNNENDLVNFVTNAQNTGGGDADEFYELVIQKIVDETQWREGSNKSVLFIGDCNPHKPGFIYSTSYPVSPDWRVEAKKAADKGIIFDTLSINGAVFYKNLAELTGGVCLPFKNSAKTSQVLEATALARGGEATRAAFRSKSVSSEVTADGEMSAVYSMYSKEVINKK